MRRHVSVEISLGPRNLLENDYALRVTETDIPWRYSLYNGLVGQELVAMNVAFTVASHSQPQPNHFIHRAKAEKCVVPPRSLPSLDLVR